MGTRTCGDWVCPGRPSPTRRPRLRSYGVFGPPETFFIGADGVIAGRHIGPIDEATLVNGIETLRARASR